MLLRLDRQHRTVHVGLCTSPSPPHFSTSPLTSLTLPPLDPRASARMVHHREISRRLRRLRLPPNRPRVRATARSNRLHGVIARIRSATAATATTPAASVHAGISSGTAPAGLWKLQRHARFGATLCSRQQQNRSPGARRGTPELC